VDDHSRNLLAARFGVGQALLDLADDVEDGLTEARRRAGRRASAIQARVLDAFLAAGVAEEDFAETTGYGYHSVAHARIDAVFAAAIQAEEALVSTSIVSGTHAIALALYGNLRPGDELVSATGAPYDTLLDMVGARAPQEGTLASIGVTYREVPLLPAGRPDHEGLAAVLGDATKIVLIQKSRGYAWRPSLSAADIADLVTVVRGRAPQAIVFVDNCYGEFVEEMEPTAVGADLMAGSLIKNPGGGIAPGGGYVAGKSQFVRGARRRLTAPGVGGRGRISATDARLVMQGLFLAPQAVEQALCAADFAAALFDALGYPVSPGPGEERYDIIQAIRLGTAARLGAFAWALQSASPVNSRARPEPAEMEGYPDRVLMAGGTFVQGSSIELSADAPLRPPYDLFVQGGLSYAHARLALINAAAAVGPPSG
jgi:cystathionine beta-lyase family protein involved in aluminum resistance